MDRQSVVVGVQACFVWIHLVKGQVLSGPRTIRNVLLILQVSYRSVSLFALRLRCGFGTVAATTRVN